ncbi:DUF2637 domain-containing protein [Streptomyces sp. NPDC059076]|uniref:DUF2637 domain-containing protein n=1 Tax=unclassified Streptomyces TaxID=2593676 RepID=UPI003683EB2A
MSTAPAAEPHTAPTAGAHRRESPSPTSSLVLTRTQQILIGLVVLGTAIIAAIGFAGSYTAVTALAREKGFGDFAKFFTIGVDSGIGVLLALDLILTWLRIPFPLLRQTAWLLTVATIAFNGAASWPDPLGVGMHAVIPLLFVISVEAARHAIGRIADITADKHIESPPWSRWLLNPYGTFVIWRRMRLWDIRSYEDVIQLQREVRVYRAQLKTQHGRRWRRKAAAEQLLVLTLAADGMSIEEAIELPHLEAKRRAQTELNRKVEAEAQKRTEAEAKHQSELRAAEVEAKRRTELARAEAAEAEARIEVEAKQRAEAEAARLLAAETEAKLAALARQEQMAEAEAELNLKRQAVEAARIEAEAEQRARAARAAEAQRRKEEQARTEARRLAAEAASRTEAASGSVPGSPADPKPNSGSTSTSASGSASGSDSAPGPQLQNIAGQRTKKQTEVEAVLALIAEAGDPKSVSLEQVKQDFGLKHGAAWDRLSAARTIWQDSQTA